MKRTAFFLITVAMAALSAMADNILTIRLEKGDVVGEMLTGDNVPDSIIVTGPMTDDDIYALRRYCLHNPVLGVNLWDAQAPNDSLPWYAFGRIDTTSVKHFTLPKGLKYIGYASFYVMTSLETIDIPESVTSIGSKAFSNCTSLRELHLPQGLKEVGREAFCTLLSLTELKLPPGLKRLDNCSCTGLPIREITIPDSIEYVGWGTFSECEQLEKVTFPSHVKRIPKEMFWDAGVKDIAWPADLESIGNEAFAWSLLEEADLPGKVRVIEDFVFRESKLRVIRLPESLELIGRTTFLGCTDLREVHCAGVVPAKAFDNSNFAEFHHGTPPSQATLYVPKGAADAYRAAEWWREFGNIVEEDMTGIVDAQVRRPAGDNRYYRLDGTAVGQPGRGLHVHNGKKYLVK